MNINERMAKVMGWVLIKAGEVFCGNLCVADCYTDNSVFVMFKYDWHPDTSIEQALMCAEKAGANIQMYYSRSVGKWELCINSLPCPVEYDEHEMMLRKYYTREELPLAICNAILEAKDE